MFHYTTVNKLFISFVFIGLIFSVDAQIQQKDVPLVHVLEYLEKQHPTYRFNYLFSTIDGVLIPSPPENSSFTQYMLVMACCLESLL